MADEPEKQPTPRAEREIDLDDELVAEAFELSAGDRRALEKKILAVAFLLEACAEEGMRQVDATLACGLAEALRSAAEDAARLRRQDET